MNNRISTGMMFSQSVVTMLSKQSKLSHLQQQLSSGQRLVTAKDDPVAAGTAVGLDRAVAQLAQFSSNANNVQNRLGLQENALAQGGDLMTRVTELTVEANNASLTTDDRKAIASELQAIHDQMLSLANSTDGNGRYLFGGTNDGSAPFARSGDSVSYNGDQTQRQVEIAADTYVADTLPGSEIFMRIRTGDGTLDASAGSGNTGTALLLDFSRDGSSGTYAGESYTLQFTAADAYDILDANGNVLSSGTYTAGSDIGFNGVRLRVDGTPAAGDTISVGPSQSRDVFATLTQLVDALNSDPASDADRAKLQNALQASLRDVKQASAKMIDARAAGGAQLSAIDNATELRASNEVTLKTTLSSIRDLDYASAIGQYQLETAALQAAQTVFKQMQSMSLFQMMG
ncbi:MAG TPA: flagellar hook-associated protein FlgL [Stenotrophomonas sp.]|nr:flagellar hook-associated protein FlgL [Stenotrophomonas sp.]